MPFGRVENVIHGIASALQNVTETQKQVYYNYRYYKGGKADTQTPSHSTQTSCILFLIILGVLIPVRRTEWSSRPIERRLRVQPLRYLTTVSDDSLPRKGIVLSFSRSLVVLSDSQILVLSSSSQILRFSSSSSHPRPFVPVLLSSHPLILVLSAVSP